MITFWIILFSVTCLALLGWGLSERSRCYQFPFLAGAVFAGFILPQLIGLRHDDTMPPDSLVQTCIMGTLCAAMCLVGYLVSRKPLRLMNWEYHEDRLLILASVLVLAGATCFIVLYRLPEEYVRARQWSGVTVLFNFFAAIIPYGTVLAIYLFLKNRGRWAGVLSLIGILVYSYRILIAGQRKSTLELVFLVLMALWFHKRFVMPRPIMLAGILIAAVALNSVGDYRQVTMDTDGPQWHLLRKIPLWENMSQTLHEGGHEVRNAAHLIAAKSRLGGYDYGLFHWNTFVFNYVPAQLFGEEFKESLMVPMADPAEQVFSYEASLGSTYTGLGDAFGSFGYFGCLKFFVIAFFMRKLFLAASLGHVSCQLLYMLILVSSMHTITHHTHWFVTPWMHMAMFLLPGLWWARMRQNAWHVRPRSPLAPAVLPAEEPAGARLVT